MIHITFQKIAMILTISFLLSAMMGVASYILGDTSPDKEKVSVYECGFTPYDNPGNPISVSFFLMGMLFLVFDLEMSLLLPWSISSHLTSMAGMWLMFIFMFMLTWGLMYEWIKGGLEWE